MYLTDLGVAGAAISDSIISEKVKELNELNERLNALAPTGLRIDDDEFLTPPIGRVENLVNYLRAELQEAQKKLGASMKCVKCGAIHIKTLYCTGILWGDHKAGCDDSFRGEHLHHTCQNCYYDWKVPTLDKQSK